MKIEPVILSGRYVRLEPMQIEHFDDLVFAGRDPSLWKYMIYGNLSVPENMRAWVVDILGRQAAGTDLPFVVRNLENNRIVGATRYMDIRVAHKGLEIGGTWYDVEYQRTRVNTEAKYLLLKHAFETWGVIRAQFKADSRNERSVHAIERLGAVREGFLRNHMILENGVIRHSVYFSIIDEEWPAVKRKLEQKLDQ